MSLVTCDRIGQTLITWLNNATAEQIEELANLLGISREAIAGVFQNCAGDAHTPDTQIPSCDEVRQMLADAIASIDSTVFVADTTTITVSGNGTQADPIKGNVRLSTSPGNLISVRGDGLYYGITAPANVAALYVDAVNGSDIPSPDMGTRANPLRSIAAAAFLQKETGSYEIFIYEGQSHQISTSSQVVLQGGQDVLIRPYGPLTDAEIIAGGGSYVYRRSQIKALGTKIVFGDSVISIYGGVATSFLPNITVSRPAGVIVIACVELVIGSKPAGSPPTITPAIGAIGSVNIPVSVILSFCDINMKADSYPVIEGAGAAFGRGVTFESCTTSGSLIKPIISKADKSISITVALATDPDDFKNRVGIEAPSEKAIWNTNANINPDTL